MFQITSFAIGVDTGAALVAIILVAVKLIRSMR